MVLGDALRPKGLPIQTLISKDFGNNLGQFKDLERNIYVPSISLDAPVEWNIKTDCWDLLDFETKPKHRVQVGTFYGFPLVVEVNDEAHGLEVLRGFENYMGQLEREAQEGRKTPFERSFENKFGKIK